MATVAIIRRLYLANAVTDATIVRTRFMISLPLPSVAGLSRLASSQDTLNGYLHGGLERPRRAGSGRHRRQDVAGRSSRINRPSLEDDADGPIVAEKPDARNAQTRKTVHGTRSERHFA